MKVHKNIHLAKKALPNYEFDELKEYLLREWHKVPHYNFLKKTEKALKKNGMTLKLLLNMEC